MSKISDSINVHDLLDFKAQSFWAIDKLTTDTQKFFDIEKIADFLVQNGVSAKPKSISNTLRGNKEDVHQNKDGYMLMEKGKKVLESSNSNTVSYIEPGKPFAARKKIEDIFSTLSGEVKICDAYIDHRTFDFISKIDKKSPIKLLTQNIKDKPSGSIKRLVNELLGEGYKMEVHIYTAAGVLHDRYIISQNKFLSSGNSLNGLGLKESLVIELGEDIKQSMTALFDSRWKSSTPI